MNDKNLNLLSAKKSIEHIISNDISVTDLIKSHILQIEKINPMLKAWVSLNNDQSISFAENLDKKYKDGNYIGPLFGIPIGIKDIFNTEDFPCEMGSLLWKGFTPGNDARLVSDLRIANATILGKTETAEFAVHALGNSKNPYDRKRSPGTSSSGSAIAVATGMVPIALGSQTAGSIIRPASYCGVFGFKPSFGLIPRTGMLKTTDSLDQVGFFTRAVEDLELFFDVIHVKGKDYPLSNSALTDKKRQNVENRPWKIKFIKTSVWNEAEDYAKTAIEEFCSKLRQFNEFDIKEFVLPDEFSLAHKKHEIIYAKSLSYYFQDELKNKSLVSNVFYDLATKSKKISMEQFDSSKRYQFEISQKLDNLFENFDIIISLATAGYAPLRDEIEKKDPSLIWTMCGVPTVSVPKFEINNLPMGLQVLARKYNDKLLLNFLKLLHKMGIITDALVPNFD